MHCAIRTVPARHGTCRTVSVAPPANALGVFRVDGKILGHAYPQITFRSAFNLERLGENALDTHQEPRIKIRASHRDTDEAKLPCSEGARRRVGVSDSPRPGFTQHPLTVHAASQMFDSVDRAVRFRKLSVL